MLRWTFALTLLAALVTVASGCGHTCTAADCPGFGSITLLDAEGERVLARGEVRPPGATEGVGFDCTEPASPATISCDDEGTLWLGEVPTGDAPPVYEVRFQLSGGGFSDWEEVELELEEVTDPDFNGPGCSCTWTEGHASVTVPADAELSPASGCVLPEPPCEDGSFLYEDPICGPVPPDAGSGTCGEAGDGLCHQRCTTDGDCTDPCRPFCRRLGLYDGGDGACNRTVTICRATDRDEC